MRRLLPLAIAMVLFAALAVPASAQPAWSEKSDASIVETAIALSSQTDSPAGEFDDTAGDFDILVAARSRWFRRCHRLGRGLRRHRRASFRGMIHVIDTVLPPF